MKRFYCFARKGVVGVDNGEVECNVLLNTWAGVWDWKLDLGNYGGLEIAEMEKQRAEGEAFEKVLQLILHC